MIEHYPPILIINEDFKKDAPHFPQNKTYLVNGFTSGLFHDVWQVIENNLNFTSLFYKQETNNWGKVFKLPNGTFISTGLIDDVRQKIVDVAVAPLTIRSPRQQVITYLPPLSPENMIIVISKTSVLESMEFTQFVRPFHYSLWITVLSTIMILTLMKMIWLQENQKKFFYFFKYYLLGFCHYNVWWFIGRV